MKQTLVFHHGLLAGLWLVLYLPFLGSPTLFDFDEAYFASVAKEMHDNGEWIVPTYNGTELGDKPILIFWAMRVSFCLFGVSEFAVRFPTACWSLATIFLTYHLARCLFHDAALALRSAFILATMLLFGVHSRFTTCDMVTLCWSLAALTVYVYGSRGFGKDFIQQPAQSLPDRLKPWYPQHRSVVALMFACLGVVTLAKGPALFVTTTAVIGLFLLVKAVPGRVNYNPVRWVIAFLKTCLLMRPLIAVTMILLVAGPWYLAVGLRTDWEWENMFFFYHNFYRSVGVIRGHTGFPLYYLLITLFGTFPWSLFFLPCLIDLVRRWRHGTKSKNVFLFLICWIVLYFTFFSLVVNTKLPQYVMPAYPALALLIGSYLHHWQRHEDLAAKFWTPVVIVVLCVVGVGTLTVFRVLAPRYFQEELMTALLIGLFLTLAGGIAAAVYHIRGRKALDVVFICMAVLFVPLLFQYAAVKISRHAHYRDDFFQPVIEAAAEKAPLLIVLDYSDPSSTFYSGQEIRVIEHTTLEAWIQSEEPPASHLEWLRVVFAGRDQRLPKYLALRNDNRVAEGQIFLVASDENCEKIIRPLFGDSLKEVGRMRRFMRQYDMVLLTTE